MIPNCTFNRPKWKFTNILQNNRVKAKNIMSKSGKSFFDKIIIFLMLPT